MSVIERIRDALAGATDREQSHSTEAADPIASPAPAESSTPTGSATSSAPTASSASTAPAAPTERRETNLYRCDPCDITYVSEEMDACSQCSASVERVPTERDLGLV